jgi:hypothetical protein
MSARDIAFYRVACQLTTVKIYCLVTVIPLHLQGLARQISERAAALDDNIQDGVITDLATVEAMSDQLFSQWIELRNQLR